MPKAGGPPPPKAKAKSQVKWSERQKAHGRVERLLSFSVVQQWRAAGKSCCVDAVNWDDVDSVVWVAGGSGGVLLVRFGAQSGSLLCVKPQRLEARGELLASLLADFLEIRTARLQIVPVSAEILSRLRTAKLEIDDHQLHVEKKILADAKYLGLVEFVQGPMMEGEDFAGHFRETNPTLRLARFWRQAGRLAAFDCLINNLDRLPLIWENDGNLKNLMVDFTQCPEPQVVGIDQAVRGINSDVGLAKYLRSLQALLQAVWGDWLSSPFLQRICSTVEVNFQEEFHVDAWSFRHGLQQAFRLFAWRFNALSQCLEKSVAKVAGTFGCDVAELDQLKRLVQAAGTTISEEVQKLEMNVVPKPLVDSFRRLLPEGLFKRDQLSLLLHLLDSELEMPQAKEFLERCFPEDEDISCPQFLQLLFAK